MSPKRIAHYRAVLESELEDLPILEANAADRNEDKSGGCTSILALAYRSIGTSGFLLDSNVDSFRTNLSRSAALRLSLFQRFSGGEAIDPSYVAMLAYQGLFDALAAGNFRIATELARSIGGRPEIEAEFDHPLDLALGYALKATMLMEDYRSSLDELRRVVAEEENQGYRGYSVALDGLAALDENKVSSGLALVVADHPKQAKSGVYHAVIDEDLCVWGIGLANFAMTRGLAIHVDSKLIPIALII